MPTSSPAKLWHPGWLVDVEGGQPGQRRQAGWQLEELGEGQPVKAAQPGQRSIAASIVVACQGQGVQAGQALHLQGGQWWRRAVGVWPAASMAVHAQAVPRSSDATTSAVC